MKSLLGFLMFFSCSNLIGTNYYVNDNSTLGDVFCVIIGNVGYDGLSINKPKLTLTSILSTYSLWVNDTVFVDASAASILMSLLRQNKQINLSCK